MNLYIFTFSFLFIHNKLKFKKWFFYNYNFNLIFFIFFIFYIFFIIYIYLEFLCTYYNFFLFFYNIKLILIFISLLLILFLIKFYDLKIFLVASLFCSYVEIFLPYIFTNFKKIKTSLLHLLIFFFIISVQFLFNIYEYYFFSKFINYHNIFITDLLFYKSNFFLHYELFDKLLFKNKYIFNKNINIQNMQYFEKSQSTDYTSLVFNFIIIILLLLSLILLYVYYLNHVLYLSNKLAI